MEDAPRSTNLPALLGEPSSLPDCISLRDLLRAAAERPADAQEATAALLSRSGDLRLQEALGAGRAWAEAQEAAGARFAESAFGISADTLRARLAPGVGSFWARLFGTYRAASKELATVLSGPLPGAPADRLQLVDELVGVQRRRRELTDEEGWLKEVLGPAWRGERTPFMALLAQAEWLSQMAAIVPSADAESIDWISAAADREAELTAALDGLALVLDPLVARLAIKWPEGDGISLDTMAQRIEAMRVARSASAACLPCPQAHQKPYRV